MCIKFVIQWSHGIANTVFELTTRCSGRIFIFVGHGTPYGRYFIFALLLSPALVSAQAGFRVTPMHKAEFYASGVRHTLAVEVQNPGVYQTALESSIRLPGDWDLITVSKIGGMYSEEKKLVFISFYIPRHSSPGEKTALFEIRDPAGIVLASSPIPFIVPENHQLEVHSLPTNEIILAGDTASTSFEIKNKGNITETLKVSSRNAVKGSDIINLAPGSSVSVRVTEKTSKETHSVHSIVLNLELMSQGTGEVYKAYTTRRIFPSETEKKDVFFRYPLEASLYHSSYSNGTDRFAANSFELRGNGFLDQENNHQLKFIFRGINQARINRFGINDQYSLVYSHRGKTTLYLGDHSYSVNRLAFNSRFGTGFRLDQQIREWTLSAFYTRPRFLSPFNQPFYGAKAVYNFSTNLSVGASLSRTSGQAQYAGLPGTVKESGQIGVFEINYKDENTLVTAEVASSVTNEHTDYAADLRLSQTFGNFRYTGSATLAGKNFFGALNNSLRYANTLTYAITRWNFGIGQGFSKVHERLDTLNQGIRPSFDNQNVFAGYRFKTRHSVGLRLDRRVREDRSDLKRFHYKEYGLNYRYQYTGSVVTFTYNGRLAKTLNLLASRKEYRNTYGQFLGLNYKISKSFGLRANLSHNRNNRYADSNRLSNYFLYGGGVNFRPGKNMRVGASYNSGFSPEETYRKRDFISASASVRPNRNHRLETRINYYANPNVNDQRNWSAFIKYTYSFGAPLKRVGEQISLVGILSSPDSDASMKGIGITLSGQSVRTNGWGGFEINNLSKGTHYLVADQATLPDGLIPAIRMPYEIRTDGNTRMLVNIPLVRAGMIKGTLQIAGSNSGPKESLGGYVKLQNDDFTYFIEADDKGHFEFRQVVPGTYQLLLLRLKNPGNHVVITNRITVEVLEGITAEAEFFLKEKERNVRFSEELFKVEG